MSESVIIVGASHTGSQLVASLRQNGYEGRITLIGDETVLPYHRPPLSKGFLSGGKSMDDILIRPAGSYESAEIDIQLGKRVVAIDRQAKTISLDDGESLAYSKLILATGARVRPLPIPGADGPNVFYLRNSQDVDDIRDRISSTKRAIIIGGGYIGLETAASLRQEGLEVTVLEAMPRILQRVTSTTMSDFFRRLHTEEGAIIHEDTLATSIETSNDGVVVHTQNGMALKADLAIIGIGVIPNAELAEEAGLTVGNGIEVNENCQTTDPDIYAAGDVAFRHHHFCGRSLRIESVPNTTEHAKIVAAHITEKPIPNDTVPWFWSDQYDVKLQIAGLSDEADTIIARGQTDQGRSFAVFSFKDGELVGVDAVNDPKSFMGGKMAMTKSWSFDLEKLANPEIALKDARIIE